MLQIESIAKTFNPGAPDAVPALDAVTLAINPGEFVVVIGTNGSGKSTLLNAIAGVFRPDAGRIRLAGRDITRWPEHRRARLIGRVFQNPFSGTAPNLTIAENLALAARRGMSRGLGPTLGRHFMSTCQARVQALGLGLENRLAADIGTLSGGQRQALTLLMATWLKPALLLLDEHTAALDPKTADQIVRLTSQIVQRDQLTTLMVTHSMQQAVNLGARLIMMHRGRIVFEAAGADKQRLRVEHLMDKFQELRRTDRLDAGAAELLRQTYV